MALSTTNTQYLLLVALLHDANHFSADRALEQDMTTVAGVDEDRWYGPDVSRLAAVVLRCLAKAGIEFDLPEADEDFVLDPKQAIADLFRLRREMSDFTDITWTMDSAQGSAIEHFKEHLAQAVRHSKSRLRGTKGRDYVGATAKV